MNPPDIIYDWNNKGDSKTHLNKPVELADETLRDGLQSPSVKDPPIEVKLHMIELMDSLGVTAADIGLPGAGPRTFNDVLAIAKFVRDQKLGLKLYCAARTLKQDIEPVARIQDQVGIPIMVYSFLGTSPIRQYVEEWDQDTLWRTTHEATTYALSLGLDIAFVTEDTTRSSPQTLEPLFKHVINLGCKRLVLCDTVGHALPSGVHNLVAWTKKLIHNSGEDVKIDWHGHNDRGLAVYNALEAAIAGCDRIHGTCLGVGERVGNSSIDQLMVNLKLMGQYPHDLSRLNEYVMLTAKECDVGVPYDYPIFGTDAFRTATGVHAAAIIKAEQKKDNYLADTVYSSIPASWVGKEQIIEIGPMSGMSNVRYWLKKRGIENETLAQKIFEQAKSVNHVLSSIEIEKLL